MSEVEWAEVEVDVMQLRGLATQAEELADWLADEVEAGDTAATKWRDRARNIREWLDELYESC